MVPVVRLRATSCGGRGPGLASISASAATPKHSATQRKITHGVPDPRPLRPPRLPGLPGSHDVRPQRHRSVQRGGGSTDHRRIPRCRGQLHRHGQPLHRRGVRRGGRSGDQGQARRGRAGHQGFHADRRRPQRQGARSQVPDASAGGQPSPPGDGLHRRLPVPRARWRHTDRGDHGDAGRVRPLRQGPLHRLLQLDRLPDRRSAVGGRADRGHAHASACSLPTRSSRAESKRTCCPPVSARAWGR